MVKGEEIKEETCVAELGIYGAILWNSNYEILINKEIGCIMKTKPVSVNEGGIVAGFAFIDNPLSFEGTEEEFREGT